MFPKIQRNFSKIFIKIILEKIWADSEVIMKKFRKKIRKTTQIFKKFQRILQNKWNFSKNLRQIRYLNLKM